MCTSKIGKCNADDVVVPGLKIPWYSTVLSFFLTVGIVSTGQGIGNNVQ